MGIIHCVCLSDLHLGQNDGLLTALQPDGNVDMQRPAAALCALCAALRDLLCATGDRPVLVLNGDILEIALADVNVAAACFQHFFDGMRTDDGRPLFSRIVFVPGNHDHHFWELARESAYAAYVKTVPRGGVLHPPWHVSNLFVDRRQRRLVSLLLTDLLHRNPAYAGLDVEVAYPNLGFMTDDGRRAVVFHHGHYLEEIYRAMTTAADMLFPHRTRPVHVWDLEAENFAWIDFFWSTMGRSGRVGPLVQRVYNCLGDKQARAERILVAMESLMGRLDLPGPDALYARGAAGMADALVERCVQNERRDTANPLSPACFNGLVDYVETFVTRQMNSESACPEELTFIFGHTHKPDVRVVRMPAGGDVHCYNTGGFVVEEEVPSAVHGASAVLLDKGLHAVSLQLYRETASGGTVSSPLEEAACPLYDRVASLIATDAWKRWHDIIPGETEHRRRLLAGRIRGTSETAD